MWRWASGVGPERRTAPCEEVARRGGWYPLWAHTGAVCASRRLRCGARSRLAPRNSLRSNSVGESDERSARRAPSLALRSSPPQKSPPPGTTRRAAPLMVFADSGLGAAGKDAGGCASAATYAAPRNAGLAAARVSALRGLTRRDCSSATNAVSEASFATGRETEYRGEPFAQRRAAASERRRIPTRGFDSLQPKQVAQRRSR
jgi:hypothetical protein